MKLEPVGGIFWRLDSSGNLTGYNTAGTVLAKFAASGAFSFSANRFFSGGNVIGTASATFVSTGKGGGLTALVSGIAHLMIIGTVESTVAGDDGGLALYRNTTGVPAQGAAVGADTQIQAIVLDCPIANRELTFAMMDVVVFTGTMYFYLAYQRSAGTGSISLDKAQVSGVEW